MTSFPRPGRDWHRYVAIGDSFTEGMADPDPTRAGAYLGWADRLAGHLARVADREGHSLEYANLAIRGRLLGDVVGPQLDAALALKPDLVSIVGGGNDLLRPHADLDAMRDAFAAAVARIRATGADVLLVTPTDPAKAGLFAALRGRHAIQTANLLSIAQEHGCFVLSIWSMTALQDWRLWAADRIHLTSEGHRRVALAALDALGHGAPDASWREPLPPAPSARLSEALAGHATWAKEYAAPWVQRRLHGTSSGDGLTPKRAVPRIVAPGWPTA